MNEIQGLVGEAREIRIAIISPKAYPVFNDSVTGTYGGAEIALSLVARQLSNFDQLNVEVLVGDYDQPECENVDKLRLHKALDSRGGDFRNLLHLLSVMKKVDADIYIQRTLSVASALIALHCRLRRRRFVYWVAHDHETDGGHPLYRNVFTRMAVRMLFQLASHVIVQNDYEASELNRRFPGTQCTLIKKGIELPEESSSGEEIYDAIWVGRCDEWKNPEAFIQLAMKHPDRRFLMICPPALGKESYHQEILNQASLCANLEAKDRTHNFEVLNLIRASRIFCMTSVQEGDWPVVVLEAASLRKPILSLFLEYSGLVDKYKGGRTFHGNFAEFSKEFGGLVEDECRRRAMGDGAFRYIKEVHDVGKQTAQLMKLINELT